MDAYAEVGTDGTTFLWILEPPRSAFAGTTGEALRKLEVRAGAPIRVVETVRGRFTRRDADTTAIFGPEREPAPPELVTTCLALLDAGRDVLLRMLVPLDEAALDRVPPHRPEYPSWARWRTVREIVQHVAYCDAVYYPSRIDPAVRDLDGVQEANVVKGLVEAGGRCRCSLEDLDDAQRASLFERDGEEWSVRKVLRRLVWHQWIHTRSIHRILALSGRTPVVDDRP